MFLRKKIRKVFDFSFYSIQNKIIIKIRNKQKKYYKFCFIFYLEPKTTSALLRRAKTFKEKDKVSNTSKSVIDQPQIDLQRNIELVYNQFSPTKLHAINVLNSPSERTRTHNSYKRNYFSVGGRINNNFSKELELQNRTSNEKEVENSENEQNRTKNHENFKLNLKKSDSINSNINKNNNNDNIHSPIQEFHNLLKFNTPKYLLFKNNYREKLGEPQKNDKDPIGRIYQSKMLMKLLMQQKQQMYFSVKNANSCSFGQKKHEISENNENSQISKPPSKFKIRNISHISSKDSKNKGSTHRKIKSTAAEALKFK